MSDGTAEGSTINPSDLLATVFVTHSARLTRTVAAEIGDWHQAEDIVQEAFAIAAADIPTDPEQALMLLRLAIREQIADLVGAEEPVELLDSHVPAFPAAEDEALANVVILAMLTQEPTPLGVAA